MSTRLVRSLYGNVNGDWLVTVTPESTITPPTIRIGHPRQQQLVELTRLGSPNDVVTALNYTMDQAVIAEHIGVTQQAVSRYVIGSSEPRLEPAGWRTLVQLVCSAP